MSYPGPPGLSRNASSSHHSLPPRPPPSKLPGFKPAFSAAPSPQPITAAPGYPATTSYSSAPGYPAVGAPGSSSSSSYGAPAISAPYMVNPAVSAMSGARGGYGHAPGSYGGYQQQQQQQQQTQQQQYQQQSTYYGAGNTGNTNFSSAPQIRNPFPAPNAAATTTTQQDGSFDPEMAAQIAQWQSAYMPKDPSDPSARGGPGGPATTGGPGGARGAGAGNAAPIAQAAYNGSVADPTDASYNNNTAADGGDEKKKTVYREGGGKKWQDDSLLEWDPAHLRLFVGNLAGETTDESLLKAFSRWKSVQKAKVVRDKRTTKSKGFGFVSFSDPDDFFQAAKEMNGKYIQSHPVVVHKAKTEVKPVAVKDDRRGGKNHKKGGGGGGKNKSGNGMGGGHGQDGGAYEPHLGPVGGGVTKPGQKTRGGLKLLG
ncbi:hypothetical protein B0T17DRAFT_211363 [Bombardia bombarda]|uniref:RRM domain-containing protein n=1 Tax=Bombardia bombarda TaxID=252184 RepID=A0AA39XAJ8_9PEZI|nr:hypothetical protein B0T17DRAFT_211363 [Bombardia bombarda]